MRRKTLWNCLKSAGLGTADTVEKALYECGIEPERRGETLSMEEFGRLSVKLSDCS